MLNNLFSQLKSVPTPVATPAPKTAQDGRSVGLLLAAGRGSRFDPTGKTSKLLQPVKGFPVVCHTAAQLVKACGKVIAVVRPRSHTLRAWLEQAGCQVIECADSHSGMGHSLAWGVAEAERLFNPEVIVVALGDMPFVKANTIASLIAAVDDHHQAVAPEFMGRRGNPVVFGKSHFPLLGRCTGDRGAAAMLKPEAFHLVTVSDPGVLRDIDSPDDLKSLIK